LMGSYSFEHWSQYKTDDFMGNSGFAAVVQRNHKNVHTIGVAGEWVRLPFLPQLTARVGVTRSVGLDPPANTVSPSLTDAHRWSLAIGAGYDILPRLRLDVGFQHQMYDSVTSGGPDAFPGTYNTSVDFVSVGINWRMDLARNK